MYFFHFRFFARLFGQICLEEDEERTQHSPGWGQPRRLGTEECSNITLWISRIPQIFVLAQLYDSPMQSSHWIIHILFSDWWKISSEAHPWKRILYMWKGGSRVDSPDHPPPWLSIDCCVKEGMPVRQLVPTPPHHQTDMWPSMWLLSGRRNQRGGWGKVNLGVVTIALIFLLLRWKVTQFKKDIYIDTGTILS